MYGFVLYGRPFVGHVVRLVVAPVPDYHGLARKALLQVLAARHRVPERRANVLQLQKLLPFARALGPKYELRVLSHLVCLQLAGVNSDAAMPAAQWAACLANVTRMVSAIPSY